MLLVPPQVQPQLLLTDLPSTSVFDAGKVHVMRHSSALTSTWCTHAAAILIYASCPRSSTANSWRSEQNWRKCRPDISRQPLVV
eukprot:5553870-Amphidinium_carterae.1